MMLINLALGQYAVIEIYEKRAKIISVLIQANKAQKLSSFLEII